MYLKTFWAFNLCSQFVTVSGSAAITKVFEGEPDHLTPSVSDGLLDNDMFAVAGRMIGHTFLHGGPSFTGLSPAIVHILFGGSLETTPLTLQDCPDLDIRDTVKMVSIEFKVTIWKLSGMCLDLSSQRNKQCAACDSFSRECGPIPLTPSLYNIKQL